MRIIQTVAFVALLFGALDAIPAFPLRIFDGEGPNPTLWTLRHVSVLHHHTLRAPSRLPVLNYSDHERYPRGLGRSTFLGLQEAHIVGKIWRRWWRPRFLSGDPNEVFARTAFPDPCFETTQALLFEIFSVQTVNFSYNVPFDPVPIVRPPEGFDKNDALWPVNVLTISQLTSTPVPRQLKVRFETLGDFIEYVRNRTGLYNMDLPELLTGVVDRYIIGYQNDYNPPAWVRDIWKVWRWASDRVYLAVHNILMASAGYGIVTDIAKSLRDVATSPQNAPVKKLSLFGYHDLTISAIMTVLKPEYLQLNPRPGFLFAIFFELYESNMGQYAIRVRISDGLKKRGEYSPLRVIQVNSCRSVFCPIEEVLAPLEQHFSVKVNPRNPLV